MDSHRLSKPRALLVDPADHTRQSMAEALGSLGVSLIEERDGLVAWDQYQAHQPGVVLSAIDLPGLHAWELLKRVREQATTPFVIHSTKNDAPTAITAIRAGADDFIVLPDELASAPDRIQSLMERHLGTALYAKTESLVVGRCPSISRVREKLRGLAGLRIPVLIRGEGGSGRDHVASVLAALEGTDSSYTTVRHSSPRPPNRQDAGRIVYLDSIDRFPLGEQHLWAQHIGRSAGSEANAPQRVLASTSADLGALAQSNAVDPLLAERLAQFTIDLPPLRDRREDVAPLARHLANQIAARMGRERVVLTDPALRLLRSQSWPGNVKELEGVLEQLIAYSQDGRITRAGVLAVLRECPSSVSALRASEEKRQREELSELLAATGGNLAEVGRRLGMSRGAVIYRAQKFGLIAKRG